MKNQKYLKYMITIGTKWELYKTRSFGTKTQGEDFRYAVNFAIIAKIQGIAKIQIFAMHSNFRYDSEKLCIAKFSQGLRNFRYGCEIFAILAKFSQCIAKIMLASCCLLHPIQPPTHQFLLTFLQLGSMKSLRILTFSTNTTPSLMTEVPKTCKTYQKQPRNEISGTKWTCTCQ